ncbi:MAG: hypothetical protein HY695_36605 [Deltaproteobacteria bacterium]|nr:hypothetical protein [Deltaproteobacteria bacterium]
MQVNVRFYGFVRDVIGASGFFLEMPPSSTIRDLLGQLVKAFGERLRERLLTAGGDLETNVRIFIGDDQAVNLEEQLGEPIGAAEVKIFVLSATAGG